MGSSTLVSLEEYLHTTYHPDCDYVEGEVLERNMGEQSHARLQGFLMALFFIHRDRWQLRSLTEQRVQVRADRFRIPDVCVVPRSDPNAEVLRTPPLLCVEVLSSDDSLPKLRKRVDDYVQMGVPHIWIIDPWNRIAYRANELFQELDIA
jgi:Uma2 family endonuclease